MLNARRELRVWQEFIVLMFRVYRERYYSEIGEIHREITCVIEL